MFRITQLPILNHGLDHPVLTKEGVFFLYRTKGDTKGDQDSNSYQIHICYYHEDHQYELVESIEGWEHSVGYVASRIAPILYLLIYNEQDQTITVRIRKIKEIILNPTRDPEIEDRVWEKKNYLIPGPFILDIMAPNDILIRYADESATLVITDKDAYAINRIGIIRGIDTDSPIFHEITISDQMNMNGFEVAIDYTGTYLYYHSKQAYDTQIEIHLWYFNVDHWIPCEINHKTEMEIEISNSIVSIQFNDDICPFDSTYPYHKLQLVIRYDGLYLSYVDTYPKEVDHGQKKAFGHKEYVYSLIWTPYDRKEILTAHQLMIINDSLEYSQYYKIIKRIKNSQDPIRTIVQLDHYSPRGLVTMKEVAIDNSPIYRSLLLLFPSRNNNNQIKGD